MTKVQKGLIKHICREKYQTPLISVELGRISGLLESIEQGKEVEEEAEEGAVSEEQEDEDILFQ